MELASGLPPVGLAVAGDGSTFVALPGGVLRLRPDGTPDPGFGRDGVTTAGVQVGDRITGVQLDSLTRPLVTILTPFDTPHNSDQVRVVRLRPDGSLDPAFSVITASAVISPIGLLIPGSRGCADIFNDFWCEPALGRTRVANHSGAVRARTTAKLEADGSIDQPGSTDPG